MWRLARTCALALVLLAVGCGGGDDDAAEAACAPYLPATTLVFADSAVVDCEPIDVRFTCDGENVSPPLSWAGVPEGTESLALLVEDPDAPGGTFTHWLVYGLDPAETGLPEGVPVGADISGAPTLLQGTNDFGTAGYGGPCPPEGEAHDYVFTVVALDEEPVLDGGAAAADVHAAIEGHVVGEAKLTAPYARS